MEELKSNKKIKQFYEMDSTSFLKVLKGCELKVKEKTYDQLKTAAVLLCAKIEKLNESLKMQPIEEKEFARITKEAGDDKTKLDQITAARKAFDKAMATKKEKHITCFEEFIYEQLFSIISKTLMENVERQIDEDFNELYPVVTSKA